MDSAPGCRAWEPNASKTSLFGAVPWNCSNGSLQLLNGRSFGAIPVSAMTRLKRPDPSPRIPPKGSLMSTRANLPGSWRSHADRRENPGPTTCSKHRCEGFVSDAEFAELLSMIKQTDRGLARLFTYLRREAGEESILTTIELGNPGTRLRTPASARAPPPCASAASRRRRPRTPAASPRRTAPRENPPPACRSLRAAA